MLRGVKWAVNIKFTLHSSRFYSTIKKIIGMKENEERMLWYVFQNPQTGKEFTHRCMGT